MPEDGTSIMAVIFVAERNASERDSMREVLTAAGYVVVAVPSLDSAKSLLHSNARCDLLIISTRLLEGNEECLDRLFAITSPPPKVIVYGFDANSRAAINCLNRGAWDFLPKPFNRDELVQTVENALGMDSATAAVDGDELVASSPVSGWIELTASSKLEQLRRIQRFYEVLFDSSLPRDVCEDLKMAVEEVGRNAIEWGNRFDPTKRVRVSYCRFDDRIIIKIEDEGKGFNPGSVPDPTANPKEAMQRRLEAGKRPGGYGVYLIQKLMDEVVYNEKGNTVLMIKYLPEIEESGRHAASGAD